MELVTGLDLKYQKMGKSNLNISRQCQIYEFKYTKFFMSND